MNESQCKIHKKCKFLYNSIHEGFNNTADSAKFSYNINHSIIIIIGYNDESSIGNDIERSI